MSAGRPSETETERADRNFGDILQELRVAQTGVQILFAFLLTIPMQARFPTLDNWQKDVFVTALVTSALATACIIAPVAYHRVLFQRSMKADIVQAAARLASFGLFFLGFAVVASVHLVLDLVLGRTTAIITAGVLLVILVVLWVVMPYAKLVQRRQEDDDAPDPAEA
jgi:hypothetical protein